MPAKQTKDTSLQQKIDKKINGLKQAEKDIPSIIIVHDLRDTSVVYMSERGLKILGVTLDELIAMGPDYHIHFFNAEDAKDYVPKIMGLLERNNNDEVVSVFQQVKHAENNEWRWYLSGTKIFMHDDKGAPLMTITNAIPVDAQHHMAAKAQRLLNENNFLRNNHHVFNLLSKREKEILKLIAKGFSSVQIAKSLHISEMTAITHRRNIRKKLKTETMYDITLFAQAFDLI
jgi:DNA-binding CsgD family transcriptional regulator